MAFCISKATTATSSPLGIISYMSFMWRHSTRIFAISGELHGVHIYMYIAQCGACIGYSQYA